MDRIINHDQEAIETLLKSYHRGNEVSKIRIYSPGFIITRNGARDAKIKLAVEYDISENPQGE